MTNNEELVNTAYETSDIIEYDNILSKFENFMHRNIDEDVLVHLVDDYCELKPVNEGRERYEWIDLDDFNLANKDPSIGGARGLKARVQIGIGKSGKPKWGKYGTIKEYTPGGLLRIFTGYGSPKPIQIVYPDEHVQYHK